MTSLIDPSKPTSPVAYTSDVRANFATAASEISALQNAVGDGPFLPIEGGEIEGPFIYTASGGNTPRSAQDRAADVINALDHGADPTGMRDSSDAINRALAIRFGGKPRDVFLPPGIYILDNPLAVGDPNFSQRLFGKGWSTTLVAHPGFSPTANGVIVIKPNPYNDARAQPSVCDLQIFFMQPPDFSTTATALTAQGGTTITLASTAGVRVGSYCFNMTSTGSMTSGAIMSKVINIGANNVITIDRPTLMPIGIGHQMIFAPNRSQMVTLSPTPTLNPGDPAIKYPWAIYCDVAQSFFMDHVVVGGAWNGVYIRGQTFILGQCFVGCMNVGLDVDECYNFPKVDHFMLWGWGISTGMSGIYYDGQTVAANIGRCDDFTCDVFQTWCGIVNITAAFSWGQINQLKLDGDNSRLNVAAVAGTWLQIGKFYKTGGANASPAVPVNLSGASTVSIDNALITTAQNSPTITLAGGSLTINSGSMWNGVQGANPMISVTGGDLSMDKMRFDSSDNRGQGYLVQTGGSVRVNNSAFVKSPLPGTAAFVLTDNPRNAITNVDFNGWTFYAPGPLGRYESRGGLGVTRTNGGNVFQDPDTPTTAQVTLIPLPANAKEGKLRFFGSFPTSADTAPRMAASLRGGFNSLSWTDTYLKVFVTNSQNDATSDANTAEVASFTPLGAYAGSNTLGVTVLGINGANGAPRLLRYETAGSARFDIIMETAESGGNSGADISFRTYDDNGNSLGNPITLKRSNATVGISNLAVGTVNGPTIRAGTGAATGTQPKGSIWMRTDGAAGSTLYVTQGGGTWAAVAGV